MEILAKIEMPAPLYGAPAVAGDTLYLATSQCLYAIRQVRPAISQGVNLTARGRARRRI